jgi:glycosyltransferase involved in cell wall biosynthesis
MRVGIDATNWSNPRGYGRYARGLLRALLAEPRKHNYILFVDVQTQTRETMPEDVRYVVVPTTLAPTQAASANGRRSVRDMWAMSTAVSRTPLDVLFYPSVYTYFPVLSRAKILVGIHDVIAESYPELVFPHRHSYWLWSGKSWAARRQADYIVTVSDHAKKGIARQFKWPSDKIWIVGEAPDPVFRPIVEREAAEHILAQQGLDTTTRYIMCLGGLNPHKNLQMLLEVLADIRHDSQYADVHLVLVGPTEEDTFTPGAASARELVAQLGLTGAVHFTGFLPDEHVVHLLNRSVALVMPSLDEGYGLGAVEAAACGRPVIATCNSPLPHLLEGGGLFIDPRRADDLRAALVMMLTDEPGRETMARTALARARALTWQRAAQQFLELLDVIERGRR